MDLGISLRVKVKAQASEQVEEMSFHIHGSQVVLHWEKLSVPIEIEAAK
jgi:hypothetical protein